MKFPVNWALVPNVPIPLLVPARSNNHISLGKFPRPNLKIVNDRDTLYDNSIAEAKLFGVYRLKEWIGKEDEHLFVVGGAWCCEDF
jgi:hypothetical protein